MVIKLPKPNEIVPASRINPGILLFYSAPKVGKTELCLSLPDSLLLDLEDAGSDFAAGTKINVPKFARENGFYEKLAKKSNIPEEYVSQSLANLTALNAIGGEIIKQDNPYKYIIVDTATELVDWCEDDATLYYRSITLGKSFKGDSVLELPKGSGYHYLRMSYGKYFKALSSLPDKDGCLIVLAHLKDKMLVDKAGREVESQDLDLIGKLKAITCSRAHAIGFIYRKTISADKGKPVEEIRINFHSSDVNAGARPKHLHGVDIKFSDVVDSRVSPIKADWDKIFLPKEEK